MLVSEEIGKEYMTLKEALAEIGVSDVTFREDVKKHGIVSYRLKGNINYYRKEDIQKLKEERTRIRPVE